MLLGKYNHTLDDKNRLIIPAKWRKLLGENLIMQPGYDKNVLILRSKDSFINFYNDLKSLSNNKLNSRNFTRYLLSNTLEISMDKQGRVTLGQAELQKCLVSKDITVVGMGDYIEIWDPQLFEKTIEEIAPIISDLAEIVDEEKTSDIFISEKQ